MESGEGLTAESADVMESGEGFIAGCADVMESGVGPLQDVLMLWSRV